MNDSKKSNTYIKVNGKFVKHNWKPEPEWVNKYKLIKYKGHPLDKKVQKRVHKLYNSLTKEDQQDWLKRSNGLGWSDEYIKIALSFWSKKGEYRDIEQERVDEYIQTLTQEEKDNFQDICEVFCPENPKIHIKNSFGFIGYYENKAKIAKFMNKIDSEIKNDILKEIKGKSFKDTYYHKLKYCEENEVIEVFMKDIKPEERDYITNEFDDLEWKYNHNALLNYADGYQKIQKFMKEIDKKSKEKINEIVNDMDWKNKYNKLNVYVKNNKKIKEFMEQLDETDEELKKEIVKATEDMTFIQTYKYIIKHKDFKEWKKQQ